VVYPLINNYKSQRNVRAELSGAVDLGEPVSLYIKEDELKFNEDNIFTKAHSKFEGDSTYAWTAYSTNTIENDNGALKITGDGSHVNGAYLYIRATNNGVTKNLKIGSTYRLSVDIKRTGADGAGMLYHNGDASTVFTGYGTDGSFTNFSTTFTAFHATNVYLAFADVESGDTVSIKNLVLQEVVDHSYKLMAINDTIPSGGVNVEAVGGEMIANDRNQLFDEAGQWAGYNSPTSAAIVSEKFQVVTDASGTEGATLPVANLTAPIAGRTYRIRAKLDNVDGANLDATYKFSFGGTAATITASDGTPNDGKITTSEEEYYADVVAANTEGDLIILIPNAANDEATTFTIDDVSVKEVLGYDYYNAPAYKFGIVSSIYDQDTGAMKTSGVAGDQLEVTVQGECTIIFSSTTNKTKDYLIGKIATDGGISQYAKTSDKALPNAVGVITEDVSSSTNIPIILFQGVEFSEHFVHKNSLQVMAKCDETITKFRPVSLFLDSEGDLLCRHDDIPEQASEIDEDHTGVDPGKWGIAELGGVSGDIIPVTVAGKTTISTAVSLPEAPAGNLIQRIAESGWIGNNSASNNYTPNALGAIMETGGGGDEVPITIFGGTPIGTITDWKRTIKVTAKANGTINDFSAVSLYLDQYGNYKCIADDIPNVKTNSGNGIWVDFRKWGIAQNNASDGEDVEIIVQGRTRVRNTKDGANRGEFVRKISDSGYVSSIDTSGYELSSLGIVEKEARIADGEYGVIIIF
jgi:hypothetical protein